MTLQKHELLPTKQHQKQTVIRSEHSYKQHIEDSFATPHSDKRWHVNKEQGEKKAPKERQTYKSRALTDQRTLSVLFSS
jgi:hypothetical protein